MVSYCLKNLLVLACSVGLLHGQQILPASVCLTCRTAFVTQGCVSSPSPLCYLLAIKLTFKIADVPLCSSFPCTGYFQDSNWSCRSIISCPLTSVRPLGICNGLDVCCNLPPLVASGGSVASVNTSITDESSSNNTEGSQQANSP